MIFDKQAMIDAINDPTYRRRKASDPVFYPVMAERSMAWAVTTPPYTFGVVACWPSKKNVLSIDSVTVNLGPASASPADFISDTFAVRRLDRKMWVSLGPPYETSPGELPMSYTQSTQIKPTGEARSTIFSGTTATNTIALPSRLGIYRIPNYAAAAPANPGSDARRITFDWPIVLWGDDPGNTPYFGIFPGDTRYLSVTISGREWPYDTDNY